MSASAEAREAREAAIQASSAQPPTALRDDVTAASARLVAALDALAQEAWSTEVRTARGRLITAADVPWLRMRETWVHAVDLGARATFADLPAAVTDPLIDEVAADFAGRDDCPPVEIHADDGGRWRIEVGGDAAEVGAARPAILAWLLGRDDGRALHVSSSRGLPPALPRWL